MNNDNDEVNPYQTLLARSEGAVLRLTLNRPQVRNAMSHTMVAELRAALRAAEGDGRTRVVVLAGAGGHFCSGGDIADMAGARARLAGDPDALVKSNAAFGELCAEYARTPLALVTVVQGAVMGGGFGLACVADVTLADDSAVFQLPETRRGFLPAQVAAYVVQRLGFAEAMRLAVTGAKVESAEALRLRLVHEVHDVDSLEWALGRVVAGILECAPQALGATKKLLNKARFAQPLELVEEAARMFSASVLGAEGAEGASAFMQKRKPSWAPAPPAAASASAGEPGGA